MNKNIDTISSLSAVALKLPVVIGIAGYAGSGKSTFAGMLSAELKLPIYSFAQPIKDMLAVIGIVKGESADYRIAAQTLGTEWGRDCISPDLWVDFMRDSIVTSEKWGVIIDDVRFKNETAFVRKYGYLIHIKRPGIQKIELSQHRSEYAVDVAEGDIAISNRLGLEHLVDLAEEKGKVIIARAANKKLDEGTL